MGFTNAHPLPARAGLSSGKWLALPGRAGVVAIVLPPGIRYEVAPAVPAFPSRVYPAIWTAVFMTGQSIHAKHLTRGTGIAPPESSRYGIAHKFMHGCPIVPLAR